MPAKATWLLRVPEILAAVADSSVPFFDRAAVEQLFQLRRRQAVNLMRKFGGYQVGKAFLIPRQELVRQLELIALGAEFQWEDRRKQRVEELLEDARRAAKARQVEIAVPASARGGRLDGLPSTVHLSPGQLSVHFQSPEDLLRQLFELSKAIGSDYEGFLAGVRPPSAG